MAAQSPTLLNTTIVERHWRWVALGAVSLYCLWAVLLILQNPGLQYDEALLVLGSVHMRRSALEINLPHDPDTWFCWFGRCWPLMTVRYVGSVKEYLCLPLFALFGSRAEIVRLLSTLLGALGIWGIAKLIRDQVSATAAAATAWVIAMNPAYVDLTVFDNGTVSIWMGALGVLCLAGSRYLRRKDARTVFGLGFAMGLGVWARANFVWLIAALGAALLITLKGRIRLPFSHWCAAALGGLAGGSPFLVYQIISRGGTWEALSMFSAGGTFGRQLLTRLVMLSETLLSDREHRAIWDGPAMPDWQRWLFPMIVLTGWAVCVRTGNLWARTAALAFLFLGAFLFVSRMPVAEHHLIILVPLAAVITVFAALTIQERYRWGRAAVAGIAVTYFGCAIYWQVAAIRGLSSSGGVGQWSDAVFALADHLQEKYPTREIKILDWGLQNNIYVLSDGKIRSREIYGYGSDQDVRHWTEEIRGGGVFLLNGASNRQFPAASLAFLQALSDSHASTRRFTVSQQNGVAYAEIIEINPNSIL